MVTAQHSYAAVEPRSREDCVYERKAVNDNGLFYPQNDEHTNRLRAVPHTDTSDLTKYPMRREMVSSGLLKFDDQPENY